MSSIEQAAFAGCSSLQQLTISAYTPQIDISAFAECSSIGSVTFTEMSAAEVKALGNYPWKLKTGTIVHCID